MALKKRPNGLYRKTITDKRTGKVKYFEAKTEREVYRKIMEYEEEQLRGRLFKQIADEWWELEVENLSPSSVRSYKKATERVLEHFGKMHISDIQTSDISKFLNLLARKEYAKKTVKNHKIVINRIFHFAVVEGDIKYNPAREAELPRGLKESKRTSATPQEENIICHSQEVWLLPFFALMTGMRKGELLGLKWKDIDMDKKLIRVERSIWYGGGTHIKEPKTEAGKRRLPIPTLLYEELEKYNLPREHYVFGGEEPLSEKQYRLMYAKFQRITGVTATAHQLRHSYATLAVESKVPEDVLASIFGHRDITTTLNIYSEVRESRIIAAGAMLNFPDKIKG